MSKELLELADRVERASGPSSELDHEIRVALFPAEWEAAVAKLKAGVLGPRLTEADYPGYLPAKPFTASLDAAMTLAPTDWFAEIRGLNDAWWVGLNETAFLKTGNVSAQALRPALALTAAALRAHAGDRVGKEG